jgi:hypothetical protein
MVQLVKIVPSSSASKKYDAYFITNTNTSKKVSFGAKGMDDYTKTHDEAQQQRYIARHSARENWSDPMSAGALSRYVLWSAPSLEQGIANYKKRFNF